MEFVAPFLIGGISGMFATSITQPVDGFKVQIQISSERLGRAGNIGVPPKISIFSIFKQIYAKQGLGVLYRGLQSAIFRQLIYASARLGSYKIMMNFCEKQGKASHFSKIVLSVLSGMVGAVVGNPFDVALIRQQASISTGKNIYRNTWHALSMMVKEEGVKGLWTGLPITILRVAVINAGQLGSRDIIAEQMRKWSPSSKQMEDNVSAGLASLLTAVLSLPVDNIKVKLQKQHSSNKIYMGIWDCLAQSIQRQGFRKLWVGLPIYVLRGTPHSFILIRTQIYLTELLQL